MDQCQLERRQQEKESLVLQVSRHILRKTPNWVLQLYHNSCRRPSVLVSLMLHRDRTHTCSCIRFQQLFANLLLSETTVSSTHEQLCNLSSAMIDTPKPVLNQQ